MRLQLPDHPMVPQEERLDLHERFIMAHYLKQFNDETIKTAAATPALRRALARAVCKKMHGNTRRT